MGGIGEADGEEGVEATCGSIQDTAWMQRVRIQDTAWMHRVRIRDTTTWYLLPVSTDRHSFFVCQ